MTQELCIAVVRVIHPRLRAESDPVQVKQPGPDCQASTEGGGGREGGREREENFKGGSLVTAACNYPVNSCKGSIIRNPPS